MVHPKPWVAHMFPHETNDFSLFLCGVSLGYLLVRSHFSSVLPFRVFQVVLFEHLRHEPRLGLWQGSQDMSEALYLA